MADKKLGMVIDLALCIGCNACTVACKLENSVPLGEFNTWIESWDADDSGRVTRAHLPKLCNHCENPACVAVCPTEASYIAEDGSVQIDGEACIGCKSCVAACPYEVRYMIEEEGVVGKCTLCQHRTSHGLVPECVDTCLTGARVFGDLNDSESDISKRLAEVGGGEALIAELGLNPRIRYVGLSETLDCKRVSSIHKGGNVLQPYDGKQ